MRSGSNINVAVPSEIVPDGGWGWVIVFSSFMIHLIMDGITYAMAEIYLEPMLETLKLSRSYVSAIFSILPAVTLGIGPIAAVFTNMYGCRAVTIVGACVASFGFFLSRWWANIYYYYATIGVIGGIGFGLIYQPAIVSVLYYFNRKRSLAMGIAVSASGLGTVLFPPTMHYMIKWFFRNNYTNALLVKSAIISICVICGLLMIPLPQEPSERRRANAKRQAARATESVGNSDEQERQLLTKESASRQEVTVTLPASDNIDQHEQSCLSDNKRQQSLSLKDVRSSLSDGSDKKNATVITAGEIGSKAVCNEGNEQSKSFARQLADEVNLKFLADLAFAVFVISNFLTSLGFNVPYNFARDLAKDGEVEESHREYVIMSIGLSNSFGRIIIGYLADRKFINRLFLYNTTLIIAGAATVIAPYCGSHVASHITYASFFSFFSGGYVGLTSIIIADLVGTDKVSSAFGVVLLFQGIAVAIGTPIVGGMRDAFEKHPSPYLWPYFIFGSCIMLSGIILFAIPLLKQRQEYRQKRTQNSDEKSTSHEQQQQLEAGVATK